MRTTTECHTTQVLTFPTGCVRCGAPPKTIFTVDAGRRIDLLFIDFETVVEVTVPMCRRCWLMRYFVGFITGLTLVVGGLGGGMAILHDAPKAVRIWYVLGFMVTCFLVMLYIRNWHSRFMNRLFAGVSAGRLRKNRTFRLWLKRDEVAERLTYQSEPRKYVDTASFATRDEQAQQIFASWWLKCVVGGILLLCAGFALYELTQMEAGLRRGQPLPAGVMVVYNLVGKWPICGTLGVFGLAAFTWGASQFAAQKMMDV